MIARLTRLFRPNAPPPLQRTPSLDYEPRNLEARKRDLHLGSLYPLRRAVGDFHPDMPLHPAHTRPMSEDEALATRDFKARYQAKAVAAEQRGFKPAFDALEYKQTYRREGERLVPNQHDFIVGTEWGIPRQPGLFPAGTRVDIHSHPNIPRPGNNIPSEADHRSAHRNRTNALNRPGTDLPGAIMYDPVSDVFFGYTGEPTGRTGGLEYQRLYDPFPAPAGPQTARARDDKDLPPVPGTGNLGDTGGASSGPATSAGHG